MFTKINKKMALDYVLSVATAQGIKQKDLCDNVLDYSHFNKMCRGKETNITWDLLLNIAEKIDLTPMDIQENCLLASIDLINTMYQKISYASLHNDIDTIKAIIAEYQSYKTKSIYETQFYLYAQSVLYTIEKDTSNALTTLEKALRITKPVYKSPTLDSYEKYHIKKYGLSDNEFSIYLSILISLRKQHGFEFEIALLQDLYSYVNDNQKNSYIMPKIVYNIAYCHFMKKDYDKCISFILSNVEENTFTFVQDENCVLVAYMLVINASKMENEQALKKAISIFTHYKNEYEDFAKKYELDLVKRDILKN